MAIGQVQAATATQQVSTRPRTRASVADFGGGVASALGGLSNALDLSQQAASNLMETQAARQRQVDTYSAQKSFLEWQTRTVEGLSAAKSKAPSNPTGFTNETYKSLQDTGTAFLSGLPQTIRDKFSVKVAQVQQRLSLDAYNYEYQGTNAFMTVGVKDALRSAESTVAQSPTTYDEQLGQLTELINSSALEQPQKDAWIKQAGDKLLLANFQGELLHAREGGGAVRPADQGDVVASGLSGGIRGVLTAISKPESGGKYNVINGGGTFFDYSAHPNKAVLITSGPNKGQYSTAAGKYQFLYSTWLEAKNALGLKDFSPESQDRAAAWYAKKIYAAATGLNMEDVLATGDRAQIEDMRRILAGSAGWEGLKGVSNANFANTVLGSQGIAGGPTGSARLPNPFTDPRYASISLADKRQMEAQAMSQASRAQTEATAQLHAASARINSQLLVGVETGTTGLGEINNAYHTGQISGQDWKARTDQWGKKNSEVVSAAEAQRSLAVGVAPTTAQFNALAKNTGVMQGLQAQDQSVIDQGLVPWLRATGALPSDAVTKLSNMTNNTNTAMYAFQALSALNKTNPDTVANVLSDRTRKQLAQYESFVGVYGTNPRVMENLGIGVPARDQGTLTALVQQGEKVAKDLTTEDIMARVNGKDGIFKSLALSNPITASTYYTFGGSKKAGPPIDRLQSERMAGDYRVMFKDALIQTNGDEAQAMSIADKEIKALWRPINIDGELRVMQLAPSSFSGTETATAQPVADGPSIPAGTKIYPRVAGSGSDGYGWITDQIHSELDIPEGTVVQLVPDQQTRSEAAQGLVPSYTLATRTDKGRYGFIRQADGRPYRYAGYLSSETIAAYAQKSAADRTIDTIAFGALGGYNPPVQQAAFSDAVKASQAAGQVLVQASSSFAHKREAAQKAWENARTHIFKTDLNLFTLGKEERQRRILSLMPPKVKADYNKYVLGGK